MAPSNVPANVAGPKALVDKVAKGNPLSASEKHQAGFVLTPEDAAGIKAKVVLDAWEAAWYLGVSHRWLVKEAVAKGKVPYLKPPGSNLLLFERSALIRVRRSWREKDRIGSPPKEYLAAKAGERTVNRKALG